MDGANVGKGPYKIHGYALSGGGRRIDRVDLSFDEGKTWVMADLHRLHDYGDEPRHYAWTLWSYDAKILPSPCSITSRACKFLGVSLFWLLFFFHTIFYFSQGTPQEIHSRQMRCRFGTFVVSAAITVATLTSTRDPLPRRPRIRPPTSSSAISSTKATKRIHPSIPRTAAPIPLPRVSERKPKTQKAFLLGLVWSR